MGNSEWNNHYYPLNGLTLKEVPFPSSNDAEAQFLADIINNPDIFEDVKKIISPNHFICPEYRKAWDILCEMSEKGESIDFTTVQAKLNNGVLFSLLNRSVSGYHDSLNHCAALAEIVKRQQVYSTSLDLMRSASEGTLQSDALSEAYTKLERLCKWSVSSSWASTVFDYTVQAPNPSPLISINGTGIISRENLAVLTGRPKTCKTTFLTAIIASCLSGKEILSIKSLPYVSILLTDTEQSAFHLSKQCDRVFRLGGLEKAKRHDFTVLGLRSYEPTERFRLITEAVDAKKPDLIIIDGAADLIEDTNNLESSEKLVSNLLTMASKYNCGLITIVHSNPSSDKVRGHLGSCLERKAESIILLDRTGINRIKLRPKETRNKPFEPLYIAINDNGDPELINSDNRPQTAEDWLLFLMEPNKEYRNRDLVDMVGHGFSKSAIQGAISSALQHGRIIRNGNSYSIILNYDDIPDI